MFAPPDPTTSSASPPQAPDAPERPHTVTASTPTLPTLPTLPAAVVHTSVGSAIEAPTPHLLERIDRPSGVSSVTHESDVRALGADGSSGSPHESAGADDSAASAEPEIALPAPLRNSSWLRRLAIGAVAASGPGAVVGDLVGLGLAAAGLLALVTWSFVVTANVRRVRRSTRHGTAPHPLAVALSWFLAPVVAVAAAVAIVVAVRWVEASTFDQEGPRTIGLAATVFSSIVAVLYAAWRPYRQLARCAKWVNADGGRFKVWFVGPILAVGVAVVVQVLASLVVLSDGADGSPTSASIGAVALVVSSVALPWLTWIVCGNRAMRALEAGVTHAHGRAVREALDPPEVDPMYLGRMSGAISVSAPTA